MTKAGVAQAIQADGSKALLTNPALDEPMLNELTGKPPMHAATDTRPLPMRLPRGWVIVGLAVLGWVVVIGVGIAVF